MVMPSFYCFFPLLSFAYIYIFNLSLFLAVVGFGAVDGAEDALYCCHVDVAVNADTEDMAVARHFQFNITNAQRIAAAADSVFMVVYKFITNNTDAADGLEEAVNRAVAAADNHFNRAVVINITFKARFRRAVQLAQFRKAVCICL